jgi:cytochrome c-type biogenesis protein CcmH/NrfG
MGECLFPRVPLGNQTSAFALALLVFPAYAQTQTEWQERLREAERRYDSGAMAAFIESLRDQPRDEASNLVLAQAYLALAEIYRLEYDALDESELGARREVGQQVDDAADAGLAIVEELEESSEQQRIIADLLGTKIRSNYRAKRFRDTMEAASSRALELDPANAAAYASKAKPYLMASERHGGDIERAIELLEQAMKLNPELEKASLLLARAYEESGQPDRTEAILDDLLESNPQCRPAREVLERLRPGDAE